MLSKPFREDHKIDGSFGDKRSYGFHSGSDWNGVGGGNTDCGYKLYPLKEGEVIHTSTADTGYGNIVIYKIKGVFGERWIRYCHCREILITDGQVTPDTPIATLGSSGNSTACHLHWDVIKKPMRNWRTYARTEDVLNEYFEDPTAFFNKYKDLEEKDNMPKWFETLLQERNLSIDDEGAIRAIFDKAGKYETEVSELKAQVTSLSQSLSDRAGEVSVLSEKNDSLTNRVDELQEQFNKTRSQLDKATWQVTQLEIEIASLEEENERFRKNNDLYAYDWISRFVSLFKGR